MIEKITKKQEELISVYRNKWQEIVLSTETVDRVKAEQAVKVAYNMIGYEEPEIIFCQSPYEALRTLLSQSQCRLESEPKYNLSNLIWNQFKSQVSIEVIRLICQQNEPMKRLITQYSTQLNLQLRRQLTDLTNQQGKILLKRYNLYVQPEKWAIYGSQSDFCISVLNCNHNSQNWKVFQLLVRHSGSIFSFEKVAHFGELPIKFKKMVIICDRPIQLSLDSEYRLHAEGKPAIQFADGYSLYSYHGVTLPEKVLGG
ncbi:DUF6745 domain-containing protein [Argonema antarcticum]|uniref:DUF6745 domain-containing protein n=1 Tax=Argonema antarcticum TaxID=2942763 RepID=UPI002013A933|nr:hypothetical protein [Argonema antarcticum]MCL1475331.1 hypothetical protein [Argonema antarcticum A004/B2]